jgi:hypothetical protein
MFAVAKPDFPSPTTAPGQLNDGVFYPFVFHGVSRFRLDAGPRLHQNDRPVCSLVNLIAEILLRTNGGKFATYQQKLTERKLAFRSKNQIRPLVVKTGQYLRLAAAPEVTALCRLCSPLIYRGVRDKLVKGVPLHLFGRLGSEATHVVHHGCADVQGVDWSGA